MPRGELIADLRNPFFTQPHLNQLIPFFVLCEDNKVSHSIFTVLQAEGTFPADSSREVIFIHAAQETRRAGPADDNISFLNICFRMDDSIAFQEAVIMLTSIPFYIFVRNGNFVDQSARVA